jgi:hypothetical protein
MGLVRIAGCRFCCWGIVAEDTGVSVPEVDTPSVLGAGGPPKGAGLPIFGVSLCRTLMPRMMTSLML